MTLWYVLFWFISRLYGHAPEFDSDPFTCLLMLNAQLCLYRLWTSGLVCKPCLMFLAMWSMFEGCWSILLLTSAIRTRFVLSPLIHSPSSCVISLLTGCYVNARLLRRFIPWSADSVRLPWIFTQRTGQATSFWPTSFSSWINWTLRLVNHSMSAVAKIWFAWKWISSNIDFMEWANFICGSSRTFVGCVTDGFGIFEMAEVRWGTTGSV